MSSCKVSRVPRCACQQLSSAMTVTTWQDSLETISTPLMAQLECFMSSQSKTGSGTTPPFKSLVLSDLFAVFLESANLDYLRPPKSI